MLLLLVLLFVFGIIFKTFDGMYPDLSTTGKFITVRRCMWTLLLHGIFLDDISKVMNDIHGAAGEFVCGIFVLFVFLGTFTILNMLIGFQCEVAASVARRDKANAEVQFLRHNLLPIIECYDGDDSEHLDKAEFQLLLQDPQVHDILGNFGTAVRDLLNLKDIIYEDKSQVVKQRSTAYVNKGGVVDDSSSALDTRLTFNEFIEVVLRLRGKHPSSVTDIVELREYMRHRLERLEEQTYGRALARGEYSGELP